MKELEVVKERVRVITQKVAELDAKLQEAIFQRDKVEAEKNKYQSKLNAAEKLVNGLASENKRWNENVKQLQEQKISIVGDSLLAAVFVSYIAPFSNKFRSMLWREMWIPGIKQK